MKKIRSLRKVVRELKGKSANIIETEEWISGKESLLYPRKDRSFQVAKKKLTGNISSGIFIIVKYCSTL
ncbi:MAG: hypothetical protein WC049_00520 [Candidatus Ratteibacteria bacterium]